MKKTYLSVSVAIALASGAVFAYDFNLPTAPTTPAPLPSAELSDAYKKELEAGQKKITAYEGALKGSLGFDVTAPAGTSKPYTPEWTRDSVSNGYGHIAQGRILDICDEPGAKEKYPHCALFEDGKENNCILLGGAWKNGKCDMSAGLTSGTAKKGWYAESQLRPGAERYYDFPNGVTVGISREVRSRGCCKDGEGGLKFVVFDTNPRDNNIVIENGFSTCKDCRYFGQNINDDNIGDVIYADRLEDWRKMVAQDAANHYQVYNPDNVNQFLGAFPWCYSIQYSTDVKCWEDRTSIEFKSLGLRAASLIPYGTLVY